MEAGLSPGGKEALGVGLQEDASPSGDPLRLRSPRGPRVGSA
jgi:hypothetical protein